MGGPDPWTVSRGHDLATSLNEDQPTFVVLPAELRLLEKMYKQNVSDTKRRDLDISSSRELLGPREMNVIHFLTTISILCKIFTGYNGPRSRSLNYKF